MAFKMKGSPYKNVGYTKWGPKSAAFQKETRMEGPRTQQKKKQGLYKDISGPEMQAYIKKIEKLGNKATQIQKDKADEYRYYMP